MVEQYPHYVYVKHLAGESFQDDDGNWTTTGPTWTLLCKGREETNGAGRQINGTDGKARIFSSVVYMPKGTQRITEGTEIFVSESNSESIVGSEIGPIRVMGTVMKFDSNQLNARLWV